MSCRVFGFVRTGYGNRHGQKRCKSLVRFWGASDPMAGHKERKMIHRPKTSGQCCPGVTRRSFLADTGLGFTGLALAAMLFEDGVARGEAVNPRPDGRPHFPPKAKSVIWIFLCGGVSHVESFDPKPELNTYNGKSIESTPYKDAINPEKLKNVVAPNPAHGGRKVLMGLNTGVTKHGQSGL